MTGCFWKNLNNNIVFAPGDPCSENCSETSDDTVTLPQPGAQLYQGGNSLEIPTGL